MLVRLYGRVVHPHGDGQYTPITGDGVIEYVMSKVGKIGDAIHGQDRHRVEYTDGIVSVDWVAPGEWTAYVYPNRGSEQARAFSMTLGIPDDGTTDITLADALAVEVDGKLIVKGDDGDRGASAYEVAVMAGFVGTEAEWLASLKGEPGEGGGGVELPLAGTDVTAVVEGGSYTAQELFVLYYSLISQTGVVAVEANTLSHVTRAAVTELEARVAALEAAANT